MLLHLFQLVLGYSGQKAHISRKGQTLNESICLLKVNQPLKY